MEDELENIDGISKEDAGSAPPQKGKSSFLLIAVLVIALSAAVVLVYMVIWPDYFAGKKENKLAVEAGEKAYKEKEIGVFLPLGEVRVNVQEEGKWRYLVVQPHLEVPGKVNTDAYKVLSERMPEVRNIIMMILATKRADQLRNPRYMEDSIKVQIKKKVNDNIFGLEKYRKNEKTKKKYRVLQVEFNDIVWQ